MLQRACQLLPDETADDEPEEGENRECQNQPMIDKDKEKKGAEKTEKDTCGSATNDTQFLSATDFPLASRSDAGRGLFAI